MLRRAYDFKDVIDDFVASPKHKELRSYELSGNDWAAIALVKDWLRSFRDAILDMSTTKHVTLSYIHAVFKGLQDHIKNALHELPDTAPPTLRDGLVNAHRKLSDYYYKFDESPYYIWAAILDPRIGYVKFYADSDDDPELQEHINKSLELLRTHYNTKYVATVATVPITRQPQSREVHNRNQSPHKHDFTARYKKSTFHAPAHELDELLRMASVDWEGCDPVRWWAAHQMQFPTLSLLARDILTIPGSSVAVERIFSGGRDTISLRRASLKPGMIRALMLLKNRLQHTRSVIDDMLGD